MLQKEGITFLVVVMCAARDLRDYPELIGNLGTEARSRKASRYCYQ